MGNESIGMTKPLSYQAIFSGLQQYLFFNKKKDTFKNFSKYFVKRKLVIPLCLMYILPETTKELISYAQHIAYPHNITQLPAYKFCNPFIKTTRTVIYVDKSNFNDHFFRSYCYIHT
jgi:hypothetical protein